jgi:hypothetical protein
VSQSSSRRFPRLTRSAAALALTGAVGAGLVGLAGPAQAAPTTFTVRLQAVHSQKLLTVAGTTAGSQVQQTGAIGAGGPREQWRLRFASGVGAQIENVGVSGACMEPSDPASISPIVVRTCVDTGNPDARLIQFWRKRDTRLPDGNVVSRWQNVSTGQYLAIENVSQADGARLIQFPASGGQNHMFDTLPS